jgi:hypothetical protein
MLLSNLQGIAHCVLNWFAVVKLTKLLRMRATSVQARTNMAVRQGIQSVSCKTFKVRIQRLLITFRYLDVFIPICVGQSVTVLLLVHFAAGRPHPGAIDP